jgi:uncharacterized protein YecE (DUF72 family)
LPRLYIGPAGWSYPDWNGVVYPRRKPRGFDPLEYIASYFNLVEINSTFYRLPARETAVRWADRVAGNPGFRFSVKAHRDITHVRMPPDHTAIDAFKNNTSPLFESGRLLCVLLQFPWSFRNNKTNRARLADTVRRFRPFPVSVELRHGGWNHREAVDSLSDTGATVCAIDQPLIGESLTIQTNAVGQPGAYFRFHGRNRDEWFRPGTNRDLRYNYLYSGGELDELAKAVRRAMAPGEIVSVVLNNHFRGQAVANALELKSILTGTSVPVPGHLTEIYPRLEKIASADPNAPAGEGWLFDPPSPTENDQ